MNRLNNEHHDEDEEDAETLAAIDEGLHDCEEGRVVSADEARKLVNEWISQFSTQKRRKTKA